jgi:hypothetical protein
MFYPLIKLVKNKHSNEDSKITKIVNKFKFLDVFVIIKILKKHVIPRNLIKIFIIVLKFFSLCMTCI